VSRRREIAAEEDRIAGILLQAPQPFSEEVAERLTLGCSQLVDPVVDWLDLADKWC